MPTDELATELIPIIIRSAKPNKKMTRIRASSKALRFPVDLNVKHNQHGRGGPPPEGHSRRCQAPAYSTGKQCGRWALKGRNYCARHGGRTPLGKKKLPPYYSKHAGPKLAALFKQVKEYEEQRLDLSEEVDTARIMCQKAMEIYERVVINDEIEDRDKAVRIKLAAKITLREALDHVASLTSQMAKIEALRKDKISPHNIRWITSLIMRIIQEEVEPYNSEVAKRVLKRIEDIPALEDDASNPKVVINLG